MRRKSDVNWPVTILLILGSVSYTHLDIIYQEERNNEKNGKFSMCAGSGRIHDGWLQLQK